MKQCRKKERKKERNVYFIITNIYRARIVIKIVTKFSEGQIYLIGLPEKKS